MYKANSLVSWWSAKTQQRPRENFDELEVTKGGPGAHQDLLNFGDKWHNLGHGTIWTFKISDIWGNLRFVAAPGPVSVNYQNSRPIYTTVNNTLNAEQLQASTKQDATY